MVAIRTYAIATCLCLAVSCGLASHLAAQVTRALELQIEIEDVTACLTPPVRETVEHDDCRTLADRMDAEHVPGVSVAVIHNGTVAWAQGFGVLRRGGAPVTSETLFQAGSISKPVAAMAALHLVGQGRLSLDADVNRALTGWKVPASTAAPGAVVTLRQLLSHTAGVTVHGFPGYAAGAPVPTLAQILNGEKPANTAPVRVEASPGSRWKYSGGGYTIMQQMLIDITRQPFPTLTHDTVLAPIGMTHSTYEQPLPEPLRAMSATPHKRNGDPIEGGFHTYPEMAAAGLWTTPADVARFALEIQRALRGDADPVLSVAIATQMLTVQRQQYGLGPSIGGSRDKRYFTHNGVNAGFENTFAAYEDGSNGAVVMTNAQGGMDLAQALIRSVARVYRWPDFQVAVRTAIKLDPTVLADFVGTYEFVGFALEIHSENSQLMVESPFRPK